MISIKRLYDMLACKSMELDLVPTFPSSPRFCRYATNPPSYKQEVYTSKKGRFPELYRLLAVSRQL